MLVQKLNAIRERKDADERGFTLIELLVVVVIIGILIAIAIPLYLNYQKGAHDKSASSDLRSAVSALEQCYSENSNKYPAAVAASGNSVVYTCGSTTETVNLSDGTKFLYVPASDSMSYKASAYNTGGHDDSNAVDAAGAKTGKTTYNYDSQAGGKIG